MKPLYILIISISVFVCNSCTSVKKTSQNNVDAKLKQGLVNLRITIGGYEQFQPWKQKAIAQTTGDGCAVGPYTILTTADNIADATVVQVRRYENNDYISATVKTVDYHYGLCLLEVDPKEAGKPFEPIVFSDEFKTGSELSIYWLSQGSHLTQARAILDRAQCGPCPTSFTQNLYFILTNPSRSTDHAEVVLNNDKVIGIVGYSEKTDVGVIPAETINRFLKEAMLSEYKGYGVVGFETSSLLDPAVRKHLKMPEDMNDGMYVSKVYTLGTGSKEIKDGDVILSIDGKQLNQYGKYLNTQYDRINFDHLISMHRCDDVIPFELFRDGQTIKVDVLVKTINPNKMLVPYYAYGQQPTYFVTGGYVFQKLTRDYFGLWGDNSSGKAPPHLLHYYLDQAFNPTDERQDIVVLSFVLPAPINLGYQELGRMIVNTWNGMKIRSFEDIEVARTLKPEQPYDVVEFEMNNPKIIIPRQNIEQYDKQIANVYGIQKLKNISR